LLSSGPAHAFAGEVDAVGVMNEAIDYAEPHSGSLVFGGLLGQSAPPAWFIFYCKEQVCMVKSV
jgi:hypothetical protein